MTKRIAVILGAGASFDVHNGTVPVTDEDRRPPLAKDLFSSRFWSFQEPYDGARVLGSSLGRLAQIETAFDLESALTGYANDSNPKIQRHFLDIPPYLRDVLVACQQQYVPWPTNYHNLILKLLRDQSHEALFIVLNYDILLENALDRYTGRPIRALNDYVDAGRQAKVVKVHGSTNWAFRLGAAGQSFAQSLEENTVSTNRDAIILNGDTVRTYDWHAADSRLYPALTAPLLRKSFVCPTLHEQTLEAFLADCHKFLVIGTSGLDTDVLDKINAICTGSKGYLVSYVNEGHQPTRDVQGRFENSVKAFKARGPGSIEPHMRSEGFTQFLDSDEVEWLLRAD